MKVARERDRVALARRVGLLLSLVLALTAIGGVAPAAAQSVEPGDGADGEEIPPGELPKDPEVVEVQALLDCSNMTADARAFADDGKLCDDTRRLTADEAAQVSPGMAPGGTVAPLDVRWGNCGASHIYMWNRGGGRAGTGWGFASILGTVVRRNLVVRWANWSRGTGGSFVDSNWMFSSVYGNSRSFTTRSGSVSVWVTGNVRLVWGGTCVLLVPTDHGWVS